MRTKLIITLAVLLLPLISLAQTETSEPKPFFIIKFPSSSKEILTNNVLLEASDIDKIEFIPVMEAEKRFGKLPKNAVIAKVTLKPGVKISTLGQFYKIHGVNENKRKLPFVINGETWSDTTNLFISENSLKVIKIRTDSIEIMTAGHVLELEKRKKTTKMQMKSISTKLHKAKLPYAV